MCIFEKWLLRGRLLTIGSAGYSAVRYIGHWALSKCLVNVLVTNNARDYHWSSRWQSTANRCNLASTLQIRLKPTNWRGIKTKRSQFLDYINSWWSIVSKALNKSRKSAPNSSLSSIFERISSAKCMSVIPVDSLGLKPNCFGVMSSCSFK